MQVPADTTRIGGLVILALHHVLRASVVETEDRIIHVFPNRHHRETVANVVAHLGIDLSVRIEVVIAVRPCYAEWHSAGA